MRLAQAKEVGEKMEKMMQRFKNTKQDYFAPSEPSILTQQPSIITQQPNIINQREQKSRSRSRKPKTVQNRFKES